MNNNIPSSKPSEPALSGGTVIAILLVAGTLFGGLAWCNSSMQNASQAWQYEQVQQQKQLEPVGGRLTELECDTYARRMLATGHKPPSVDACRRSEDPEAIAAIRCALGVKIPRGCTP